jgi:chromosome segregation ATPase
MTEETTLNLTGTSLSPEQKTELDSLKAELSGKGTEIKNLQRILTDAYAEQRKLHETTNRMVDHLGRKSEQIRKIDERAVAAEKSAAGYVSQLKDIVTLVSDLGEKPLKEDLEKVIVSIVCTIALTAAK